jgi:hypothetical protein
MSHNLFRTTLLVTAIATMQSPGGYPNECQKRGLEAIADYCSVECSKKKPRGQNMRGFWLSIQFDNIKDNFGQNKASCYFNRVSLLNIL